MTASGAPVRLSVTSSAVPRGMPSLQSSCAALKLPKGEVMISPVELNREKGTLEDTPRPILRYSTSVFDNTSRRRGVLIIGVAVDPIMKLVSSTASGGEKLFVVDPGGAYLSHPDPNKLFGSERMPSEV